MDFLHFLRLLCISERKLFSFLLFAMTLVFLGLGCGLADYESRIKKQHERIKLFDEENKYLGGPLEPPPGLPVVVNLTRTPKIINPSLQDVEILGKVEKEKPYLSERAQLQGKVQVYRYAGKNEYKGINLFISAYPVIEKDKETDKETETEEQFREGVFDSLRLFFRTDKEFKKTIYRPKDFEPQPLDIINPNPKLPHLSVNHLKIIDNNLGSHLLFYFLKRNPKMPDDTLSTDNFHLAFILQYPMDQKDDPFPRKALELSLTFLDVRTKP